MQDDSDVVPFPVTNGSYDQVGALLCPGLRSAITGEGSLFYPVTRGQRRVTGTTVIILKT